MVGRPEGRQAAGRDLPGRRVKSARRPRSLPRPAAGPSRAVPSAAPLADRPSEAPAPGKRHRRPGAPLTLEAYRSAVAKATLERDLQRDVIGLARLLGYRAVHFLPAVNRRGRWATHQQGDDGFPDTVLARERGRRLIFAECKRQDERPTPDQIAWLEVLDEAGAEVYVWRPADWLSGEIERVLQSETRGDVEGRSGR